MKCESPPTEQAILLSALSLLHAETHTQSCHSLTPTQTQIHKTHTHTQKLHFIQLEQMQEAADLAYNTHSWGVEQQQKRKEKEILYRKEKKVVKKNFQIVVFRWSEIKLN